MVQKNRNYCAEEKLYSYHTWQTEDVASLAQYLNNKNSGITVVTVSPILIVRKMLTFFSLWYKRKKTFKISALR